MTEATSMKMNKRALDERLDHLLQGLALGGGAAGLVALVRQVAEANRQKQLAEKRKTKKTDPNTIVLRVRKPVPEEEKTASDCCDKSGKKCSPCSSVSVEPCVETKEVRHAGEGQPREINGRFASSELSPKTADDRGFFRRVVDEGTGLYLGGAGAAAGYYLVSQLSRKLEQNRLKKQLEAAQTEYLDLLDGKTVKGAEAFSDMFLFNDADKVESIEKEAMAEVGLEKDAGMFSDIGYVLENAAPTARHLGAGMVCTYLLGVTGSAYVAKKLMEQRFGSVEEEEPENKPVRILMKSGESTFEVEPEHVLATVAIMRDCIANSVSPEQFLKRANFYDGEDPFKQLMSQVGGPQKILDVYAAAHGLAPEDGSISYGDLNTILGGVATDPSRLEAMHGAVFADMQRNPRLWFNTMGDPRNSRLMLAKAMEQFQASHPVLSSLPLMNDIVSKYYGGTAWHGRRGLASRTLTDFMGVSPTQAKEIMSQYNYNPNGWENKNGVGYDPGLYGRQYLSYIQKPATPTPPAVPSATTTPPEVAPSPGAAPPSPQTSPATPGGLSKASSFDLNTLLALGARSKTLSDVPNTELLKRLDQLKKARGDTEDSSGASQPNVKFDPELDKLLSDEDKKKILKAVLTHD